MAASLQLVALLSVLLTPLKSAPTGNPDFIKITQIPSNPHIDLGVNESVLLQIHVEGEVDGLRSKVDFGGAPQHSCTQDTKYVIHLESKPLVKNLSVICDQAYWVKLNEHRQKYEVRITNGEAARQVDRVTVTLNVFRFKEDTHKIWSPEFEINMLKDAVRTSTEKDTTVTPTDIVKKDTTATPTDVVKDTTDTSTDVMKDTTATPTDIVKTTLPNTIPTEGHQKPILDPHT